MNNSKGMDLDDYVSAALLAILSGVRKAQAHETLGEFVGRPPSRALGGLPNDGEAIIVSTVAFDLFVSAVGDARGDKSRLCVEPLPAVAANDERSPRPFNRITFEILVTIPPRPQACEAEPTVLSPAERALKTRGMRL